MYALILGKPVVLRCVDLWCGGTTINLSYIPTLYPKEHVDLEEKKTFP